MSGGNPRRRYPRSLESNYSLLRIRAPEHLDVALEGLIRKVLKEQPKMDDIYQFAADYFDMLLKIREKSGVRKLTVQDICPHHNEEDAHEMIKLASSFTKRKKEPKQYKVLSLRNGERNKYRNFQNFDLDDGVIGVQNEIPEPKDDPTRKTENEEAKKEEKYEKKEENETELDYPSKVSTKDTGELIFIKANEVVTAYNKGEDTLNEALESNINKIGDINEIRDKIKAIENEIELLGKKGDESMDKKFRMDDGKTSSENEVETVEGSEKEANTEKEMEATEEDQANETVKDESGTKTQESNQDVSDERDVPPEVEIIGELQPDSQKEKLTSDDMEENRDIQTETGTETEEAPEVEERPQETLQDVVKRVNEEDEDGQRNLESSLGMQSEATAVTGDENEVPKVTQVTEARKMQTIEQEKEQEEDDIKGDQTTETQEDPAVVTEVEKEEKDENNKGDEPTETQEDPAVVAEVEKEEKDENNKGDEPTETQEDPAVVAEVEKEEKDEDNKGDQTTETQEDPAIVAEVEKEEKDEDNKGDEPTETQEDPAVVTEVGKEDNEKGAGSAETQGGTEVTTKTEKEQKEDNKESEGATKTQEDVEDLTELEKEEKEDDKKAVESAETQEGTEPITKVGEELKEDQRKSGEPNEAEGDVEVITGVEKEEKDEVKDAEESAKVQGDSVALHEEEGNQGKEQKQLEEASKTQDIEDATEVEKEEKEEQKRSEELSEVELEAKKGEKNDEKVEESAETPDSEAAIEKEIKGQEDEKKGVEPAEAQEDTEVITEVENKKEEKNIEPTETQEDTKAEAEMKKEQGDDDKKEPAEAQDVTEVPPDIKEQEDQKESEESKEVEPEVENEHKGEEKKEEGSRETQEDAETATEVNMEEQEIGKKEESAESQGDTEVVPEEGKELKEDQKGSEELTEAQRDTGRDEEENQKEIQTTDLDMHLTTLQEKKEQTVQKSDESSENLRRDTEEQKAEKTSPEEAEVSEKTQANTDIGVELKENEVEDQKHSEETLDRKPDTEAGEDEKSLEKSPGSQEYENETAENISGRETATLGNSEFEDVQQDTSPNEKNHQSSDSVPESNEKEEDRKVGEEGGRAEEETLIEQVPNIGAQTIGNASQALITQETRNDVGLEEVKKLKGKEIVFGNESDKVEATSIQDFLTREREYSSYDKQGINTKDSASQENSVESEIKSRNVSVLGLTYGKELNTDNASVKVSVEEPDDAVDVAADDYQERDTSTTSDEIEFEISPIKYPEAEQISTDKDERSNVKIEPQIVLDLQTGDSEIKKEEDNESQNETGKTFLQVPDTVLEEYHVRKETIVEEPTEGKEVILDCSNIGNEIIQTGEVEKVELLEGDEDILQVHLTTTIEAQQSEGDSVSVEISSIEPNFKVYVETKMESPSQRSGNEEKLRMLRAAVVIQNGFRRFKNRKQSRELQFSDKPTDEKNGETESKLESISSLQISSQDIGTTVSTKTSQKEKNMSRSTTRTLLETRSLEPFRKISPLKTRSLSTVRNGIGDFEVWNQLVQELEEAATKIQSNYRGYKTRKKLQRGNAIQSATITSEESDVPEYNQSHTGEFHDSIVLPHHPK